jgi:hypothetical protein
MNTLILTIIVLVLIYLVVYLKTALLVDDSRQSVAVTIELSVVTRFAPIRMLCRLVRGLEL